ncbi:MAG: DUF86 domain-containing protein [Chlorobi bacterium]|nr:DUF86 domain-containing protein [Chlorobiota bacterium]MCI0716233.1 DUF86 domain-containing protein [Chlorobiota bacterium]
MQKDNAYLLDILQSAKIALSHLEGKEFSNYESDIKTQDAVIRRLEMIGEAANRVSEETQKTYKDLPWQKMKSMRNFLIHEYDDIDLKIVWDTVYKNLPDLISELEKIVSF